MTRTNLTPLLPLGLLLSALVLCSAGCPDPGASDDPCANQVRDANESDVDCGGACPTACLEGRACAVGGDCQSGLCEASLCTTTCQDGTRQSHEACEGSDHGGQSCADLGDFDGGILECTAACTFDLAQCTRCGDGARAGAEACESGDLDGESCESLGFGGGGALGCNAAACTFDTTNCLSCPAVQSSTSSSLGDTWAVAGPPGGHATALLSLGGGLVLAGTGFSRAGSGAAMGGYGSAIYRSTDGGVTFSLRQRMKNSTVRAFARVPGSGRIYAGVGSLSGAGTDSVDDGMWRSDDDGATWQNVSTGLHPFARVRGVVIAQGLPERVFAIVEGTPSQPINAIPSLYRSSNGGDWTRLPMTGVDQVTGGPALAMAAHLTDRDTLYLANGDRFFVSTDGGTAFTQTPFGAVFGVNGLRWVNGLHASPLDAQHLVITTYDREMFESVDGGSTWTLTDLPSGGQGTVAFTAEHVYVATRGRGLQRSTAGSFAPWGNCLSDPVPTTVAVDPTDETRLFVGFHGQGVLHTTGTGAIFAPQNGGLEDLAARVVVTGPTSAPVAWIVSGGGLHRSVDGGQSWTRLADQEGTLAFSGVAQDPADPDHILAATNGEWWRGSGTSMGVFEIDLRTGSVLHSNGLSGQTPGIIGIAFDPVVPDRAFAYQQAGRFDDPARVPTGLFVSNDGGAIFRGTSMTAESMTSYIWFSRQALAMTSTGDLLMGARLGDADGTVEVWRSSDGGASHQVIWSGTTNGPYAGIYVDPSDDLYLAGPSPTGLEKSTNNGVDFASFGVGLSGFSAMVRDVAFSPAGALLVGTVDGTYYAADGTNFVELNEGFEAWARGPEVSSVAILPTTAGTPEIALIGTHEGVFRRRLP